AAQNLPARTEPVVDALQKLPHACARLAPAVHSRVGRGGARSGGRARAWARSVARAQGCLADARARLEETSQSPARLICRFHSPAAPSSPSALATIRKITRRSV